MTFLNGALARPKWGPRQSKYTPPRVLRGLIEALALGLTLWQAPLALHVTEETWYVDAAHTKGYDHHTLRRLCGKLVWASRLGHGAMTFLNGALARPKYR